MALRLADGRGMRGDTGAHRVPVDYQPGGKDDGDVDDHVDHVDDHVDDQPGGKDDVDDHKCEINVL